MMMMMGGRSSRHPFTPAQWEELEHQVLIFRYMASGIPIPSELILPIRRSLYLQSTSTTLAFFPPQHTTGWGCFHMGLGRKEEDPEPWRCRRTDGKKWRCSKEASLDSKYCERHMHRGRSRSRKPAEVTSSSPSNSSHASSSTYLPPISMPSKPPSVDFSLHDITTDFRLGTVCHSSSNKIYRHRMDEVVDENSPSSKACGQESESLVEQQRASSEKEKHHHFFSLHRDFKLDTPGKVVEEQERKLKIFGQFLDGVPPESKGSWLDTEEDKSNLISYSRTHLSTSIAVAYHDFLQTGTQCSSGD